MIPHSTRAVIWSVAPAPHPSADTSTAGRTPTWRLGVERRRQGGGEGGGDARTAKEKASQAMIEC